MNAFQYKQNKRSAQNAKYYANKKAETKNSTQNNKTINIYQNLNDITECPDLFTYQNETNWFNDPLDEETTGANQRPLPDYEVSSLFDSSSTDSETGDINQEYIYPGSYLNTKDFLFSFLF